MTFFMKQKKLSIMTFFIKGRESNINRVVLDSLENSTKMDPHKPFKNMFEAYVLEISCILFTTIFQGDHFPTEKFTEISWKTDHQKHVLCIRLKISRKIVTYRSPRRSLSDRELHINLLEFRSLIILWKFKKF